MQTSQIMVSHRAYVPAAPVRPAEVEGLRLIGVTMHLGRDQEVFGEGEPADHVYKVVSGAVRGFRVLSDGRRQICEFYLPGDVFGIEPGDAHHMTTEALCDTVLVVARRSVLSDDDDATRTLWGMAMAALQRSQDHALTLGRRSATERVASFLTDMADRLHARDTFDLAMSRQDIADYLGLTIETVSRTLTQLQAAGLIRLTSCRSIQLAKPRALAELCA